MEFRFIKFSKKNSFYQANLPQAKKLPQKLPAL
jgi:hypothetical protein